MARISACVAVAAVCLVGCSGNDDEGSSERTNTPRMDFGEFDAAIDAFLTENGLTGASSVVVHEDYGIVHRQGYGAYTADRLYLIASSSKIVSVGVVMRLADAGLVDLDAPIATYLGAWGSYKTDVTLAQMLSNSSGLVGLVDDPLYAPYLCQYIDTGTLTDCAKTIYTADDEADRIPPDTEFHYGGGQWQLAGGVAEVVSGRSWSELLNDTYTANCDTQSLGYTNQFARAAGSNSDVAAALNYPSFFQADPANLPVTDNPSIEGGTYVTAADYGKILHMHLRGGLCGQNRVLSEGAVQRMQQDRIEAYGGQTQNPLMAGYGLGWWVDREHAGVVSDPGAYGAVPWLDVPRKYAAFLVLEAQSTLGVQLMLLTKPILDGMFDELNP